MRSVLLILPLHFNALERTTVLSLAICECAPHQRSIVRGEAATLTPAPSRAGQSPEHRVPGRRAALVPTGSVCRALADRARHPGRLRAAPSRRRRLPRTEVRGAFGRVGRGARGAPASAPRNAPLSEIKAPRPAPRLT